MNNEEKAQVYQNLVDEGRLLENRMSKLKSENILNTSAVANQEMMEVQRKITICNQKLTNLVNNG